ncbi:MAG TPA: hypothetical protein VFE60_06295, partial [Roseiarcus sp.]|nr:hypothetical protein [Roseiarcus sp.]
MTDALAAIRAEKAFVKLPPADRDRVLAALSETRRHIEAEQQSDRYIDRTLRLRHRNALKSHLTRTLKILADDVGWFDAMDWLTDHHHQGDMTAAAIELNVFCVTAQA